MYCQFKHKKFIAYEVNKGTGDIKFRPVHFYEHVYKPIYVEFEFSKKGVNKIILNETLSEHEDIARAMASALNAATDLSGVELNANAIKVGQVQNIVLGKCKGDVLVNLQNSSKNDNPKKVDWHLTLDPPSDKFTGRNIDIKKTWNMSDCETTNKCFWMGVFKALETRDYQSDNFTTINLVVLFSLILTIITNTLDKFLF